VLEKIDRFTEERIDVPHQVIAKHGATVIEDGDIVLTYAK
jgi:hypothetical protein